MSEPTAFEVQFKSKDGASHKPEIADKLSHETLHRCDEKELQEKQDKASERRKVRSRSDFVSSIKLPQSKWILRSAPRYLLLLIAI